MYKREVPFYEKVGHEVINETITAGLSLLIIFFGFNYFGFKYAWVKVIETLGTQTGAASSELGTELGMMLSSLAHTFPFKYIFGEFNLLYGFLIGVLMLFIGLMLKYLLRTSKEEFIQDMGRNIYVPAIIGLVSFLALQLVLAFSSSNQEVVGGINNFLFVWQTYGKLFIIGVVTLMLGSVVKLVAKNQESLKLNLIANTLLYGSYVTMGYYFVLRLISSSFVLNSSVGDFFKVILLSGETSAFMLLFCIFMFIFGLELQKFGYQQSLQKEAKLRLHHMPDVPDVEPPQRRY
jgi:hypothetical protein